MQDGGVQGYQSILLVIFWKYLCNVENVAEFIVLHVNQNMSGLTKTHIKSAWTPLNNEKANHRVSIKLVMEKRFMTAVTTCLKINRSISHET